MPGRALVDVGSIVFLSLSALLYYYYHYLLSIDWEWKVIATILTWPPMKVKQITSQSKLDNSKKRENERNWKEKKININPKSILEL